MALGVGMPIPPADSQVSGRLGIVPEAFQQIQDVETGGLSRFANFPVQGGESVVVHVLENREYDQQRRGLGLSAEKNDAAQRLLAVPPGGLIVAVEPGDEVLVGPDPEVVGLDQQ